MLIIIINVCDSMSHYNSVHIVNVLQGEEYERACQEMFESPVDEMIAAHLKLAFDQGIVLLVC